MAVANPEEDDIDQTKAPLIEHLIELRRRVRRHLRIASCGIDRQSRVVQCGVSLRKRRAACRDQNCENEKRRCRFSEHDRLQPS